jgi:hypothetical protein
MLVEKATGPNKFRALAFKSPIEISACQLNSLELAQKEKFHQRNIQDSLN